MKPAPDPSVSRVVESAAEVEVVGKTPAASARIGVVMPAYHPLCSDCPKCRKENIVFLAYAPHKKGLNIPNVNRVIFPATAQYKRLDLVSNVAGKALHTDPNLINGWGLAFFPNSPFWVSDAGTVFSSLYGPLRSAVPLLVTLPSAAGGSVPGTPTGIVANPSTDFVVSENGVSGAAAFIFDTEDGTISGWNPGVDLTHAVIAVNNRVSALFTPDSPSALIVLGTTSFMRLIRPTIRLTSMMVASISSNPSLTRTCHQVTPPSGFEILRAGYT